MASIKSWVLTDIGKGIWHDRFELGPADVEMPSEIGWDIQKRTLRGGLSHGVEIIEVNNGALSFSVLPTRGMGIGCGENSGLILGWDSPVPMG